MENIKQIVQWLLDNSKHQHKMFSLNSVKVLFDILNDKADNFILIQNAHNLDEFFMFDPELASEEHLLTTFKSAPIICYKYKGKEVINMIPDHFSNDYLYWKSIK